MEGVLKGRGWLLKGRGLVMEGVIEGRGLVTGGEWVDI